MTDAIQLLLDSLKIYSPSEKEAELAEYLLSRMRDGFGFRNPRIDSGGNVLGEIGSGKAHLLLCGHMDTVPGELPARLGENRAYGRGAVDAKSALCAMMVAASQYTGRKLRITVAGATREEGDSLGIETIIASGAGYDFAVLGEPAGASRITVGYRGRIEMRVAAATSGGHAASPWAHVSAVDEALEILERAKGYAAEHAQRDDHYRSMSVALTRIEGGTYSNVIPDSCLMTLDLRVPVGMSCEQVMSEMKSIARRQAETSGASIELTFAKPTEPYESRSESPLIRAFQRSIIKKLGGRPALTHKTGTGDMNTLADRLKIPCVTYGPGDSRLSHTDQEFVELKDYADSIAVLKGVFEEMETLIPG